MHLGPKTRTLTTKEEEEKEEEIKAFESTPWFRDEFGFLRKNKDQEKNKYMNPESLFNLDGNELYRTIHDRHEVLKDQVGIPPCVNNAPKTKTVIYVEDSKEDTSKDDGDSEGSEDTGSKEKEEEATNRDSASQMSSNSKKSDSLSNKGSHPKGSMGVVNTQSNKKATGAAGRGLSAPATPPHPTGGHSAQHQVEGATIMMVPGAGIDPGGIAREASTTGHKQAFLGSNVIIGEQ